MDDVIVNFWSGGGQWATSRYAAGAPRPIAPLRFVLDPLLLTAAADAGATVELGVSVTGVIGDRARITGVCTTAGERSSECSRPTTI